MTDARVLFVNGLDEAVSKDTLTAAFNVFGQVVNVEIPIDTQTMKSRGFAFVEFEDLEDARDAIDNMDMSEIYGRTIRVKVSNKRAPVQLKDPRKAIWADELYFRKVLAKPMGDEDLGEKNE
jgi:peptidyl-prolyl isomerase E (cyclophilin E)